MTHDSLGNRAQQKALEAFATMGAYHDQIRPHVRSKLTDCLRGMRRPKVREPSHLPQRRIA